MDTLTPERRSEPREETIDWLQMRQIVLNKAAREDGWKAIKLLLTIFGILGVVVLLTTIFFTKINPIH